ncbi:MAG: hypothetical protein ACE5IA_01065 [Dehalococcoidia bacterium]
MAEKILEIERTPGEEIVLRFKAPSCPLLPEAAREHFWAARKEMLLAMRSLLDAAIEWVEVREKPRGKRRAKIEVEGD